MAVLEWTDDAACVRELAVGADDAALLDLLRGPAVKVGIDCPFGWPTAFVDTILAHHHDTLPADVAATPGWKTPMVARATDRYVREHVGMIPLSVSADLIGHTALRCATLLAAARVRGVDVARDGSGAVAEVYPAAALKIWGLRYRGYKGRTNAAARDELVTTLLAAAPWLDAGEHETTMRRSDHALDAVLCAMVARAVAVGATDPPSTRLALREGWIHYPTAPLAGLVSSPTPRP